MSAFMCSDRHFAFMAYAFKRYAAPPGSGITLMASELASLARVLKYENARSIAHRYPRDRKPCPRCGKVVCDPIREWYPGRVIASGLQDPPCPFALCAMDPADSFTITPVGAIKAAQCYEYQSCEHPEWSTSEAKALTERLINEAISNLPGYESAPWGIS